MKKATIGARQTVKDNHSLSTDSAWSALANATPAQIDAWLAANVSNLADARKVLRLLIIGVRHALARE